MVDLKNITFAYNDFPWMLLGDFNVARYSDEKIGGGGSLFKN